MSFIYSQSDLQGRINAGVQGKIGILSDAQATMNESARDLLTKVDMLPNIRRALLSPNLFNGIFPYTCPADLFGYDIIDLPAQAKRTDGEWDFTTPEEFNRLDGAKKSMVALDDYNGIRVLLLDSEIDSQSVVVSELDGLNSGGGTWAAFGDATSVLADDADYVKGAGSIKWNISAAGGTTAGIVNTAVNSLDISAYLGGTSSFFVWAKINSATNLTNYKLRFGSSATVYHTQTVTTQADGTAFVSGWNLLKFDISSLVDTGTPVDTAITYFALYMTKTAGKISETDYKFDYLVLKKGAPSYVKYYSSYPWTTSAGTYIQNSTAPSDLLVAKEAEFNLHVLNGIVHAAREIGLPDNEIARKENDLTKAINAYQLKNPSQRKIIITDYMNFIQTP